jgi:hypothetical protein
MKWKFWTGGNEENELWNVSESVNIWQWQQAPKIRSLVCRRYRLCVGFSQARIACKQIFNGMTDCHWQMPHSNWIHQYMVKNKNVHYCHSILNSTKHVNVQLISTSSSIIPLCVPQFKVFSQLTFNFKDPKSIILMLNDFYLKFSSV